MKQYKFTENNITYDVKEYLYYKYWILNDEYHRENGPAVEYINGDKYWYKNGNLHREDNRKYLSQVKSD